MNSVLRVMATIGLTTLLLLTGTASAGESDKELTEKLVTGSPWTGTFGFGEGGAEAGSMTISFDLKDGTLTGEMTSFSGRGTAKPGPLDKVKVKDGEISFVTPSNGVYQEMRFDGGKLKGRWFGRSSGWLTMSPSKQ